MEKGTLQYVFAARVKEARRNLNFHLFLPSAKITGIFTPRPLLQARAKFTEKIKLGYLAFLGSQCLDNDPTIF